MSRCAVQSYNRQLPVAANEFDFQIKAIARLARHEHLRPGTRRRSRPVRPWFDPWPMVGRPLVVVDLVRRLAVQSRMGSMCVVPVHKHGKLTTSATMIEGNHKLTCELFERANQPLDDSNTPLLSNHPVANTDAASRLRRAVGEGLSRRRMFTWRWSRDNMASQW